MTTINQIKYMIIIYSLLDTCKRNKGALPHTKLFICKHINMSLSSFCLFYWYNRYYFRKCDYYFP